MEKDLTGGGEEILAEASVPSRGNRGPLAKTCIPTDLWRDTSFRRSQVFRARADSSRCLKDLVRICRETAKATTSSSGWGRKRKKDEQKRAQKAASGGQPNQRGRAQSGYLFNSIVVGKSNRAGPRGQGLAVGETGESLQPLSFWGGVGLGQDPISCTLSAITSSTGTRTTR